MTRRGLGIVLPVGLAATEVELQMLPVGSWEALALDFQQQRFEIAQLAHGLRGVSAVLPGNTSTASGQPAAEHSSPNTICCLPFLPSRL